MRTPIQMIGLYKLRNTMIDLSVDVVQEIASYLDMPTLRNMIDLSDDLQSSVSDVFALEFYRRGEKFVNWVNSLRVTSEIVTREIVETTHYSKTSRLVTRYLLDGRLVIDRITMVDGSSIKYTRSWNSVNMEMYSSNFIMGDLPHGLCEKWIAGVKVSSKNYKGGRCHGICEEWNNEGVKTLSNNYKDGQLHGLCERLDYQEMKVCSYNYKNGQRHGPYEEWNERGVKTLSRIYKDNKLHGLCEDWNNSGVKLRSENHKNGRHHGLCENWNNRGVKMRSDNYKNGQRHGLCETWNDQGVKTSSFVYEDGCPRR